MDERIDNGWDGHCARAGEAHLLRLAADAWEQAGDKYPSAAATKDEIAEVRHRLEQRAHALIARAEVGSLDEQGFAEALGKLTDLDAEAIERAVQLVKDRARPLRGQLGLFDKIWTQGGV